MGGTSSTQNQWIDDSRPADSNNALAVMADIAYRMKGGDGVATVMAIGNKTAYKLVYIKEECFSGRWERDPPGCIDANQARAMVHRKRDGAATGSSGYVEYSVQTKDDKEICKVFFGWDTPYSGRNTVGCGWLESGTEMAREDQEKVGYQQSNHQCISCEKHGLVIEIKIQTLDASPKLHLTVSRKAFAAAS